MGGVHASVREGEVVTEVAAAVFEPVMMIQAERKGTLPAGRQCVSDL